MEIFVFLVAITAIVVMAVFQTVVWFGKKEDCAVVATFATFATVVAVVAVVAATPNVSAVTFAVVPAICSAIAAEIGYKKTAAASGLLYVALMILGLWQFMHLS